jgi:tetratricopeptide (TPR) repeat protein
MKQYRLNINNQISEFLSVPEIQELISKGFLSPITLAQEKDADSWSSLRDISEFYEYFVEGSEQEDSFIHTIRNQEFKKQAVKVKQQAEKAAEFADFGLLKEEPAKPVTKKLANEVPANIVKVDPDKTNPYSLKEVQKALAVARTERKNSDAPLFPDYLPPYDDDNSKLKNKKVTKKKSIGFFSIIMTLVIVLILFDDEKKDETKNLDDLIVFDLKFPELERIKDETASQKLFEEATVEFKQMEYVNLVKAYDLYRFSYEKNSDQISALYRLALTGSLLLRYQLNNKFASASTVYKILQFAGEGREFSNLDLMTAKAYMLFYNEKYNAVRFLLEKYLLVNNKFSSLLYSVYLQTLLKVGDLNKARIIAQKLYDLSEKNLYVYRALLDYEEVLSRYEPYSKLFIEGLKIYQKSVDLLIAALNYSIESKDYEQAKLITDRIENLNYGRSQLLKSQFLELKGLYLAANGRPEDAAREMKLALEIRDSDQLRSRMAALTPSSDDVKYKETNQLILESKSAFFLKQSKEEEAKANWDQAIVLALKATDAFPSFVKAQVHLARLQSKIGSYLEAMKKLENLRKSDALNSEVNNALILVYAQASHFSKSQELINLLSQADIFQSYDYCVTLGEYYFYKRDYTKSVLWYDHALKINPTSDVSSYRMAEIYLAAGSFSNAKLLLARSIDLDPSELKYRLLYSQILYEMDDAETAIGYLRTLENDFVQHPMIWNQIAIYYYRSGQIKDFAELQQKMKLEGGDSGPLYKYLMSMALKENLSQEYIDYALEYLKQNPGDLNVRMGLVEQKIEQKKLDDAQKDLDYIAERVEFYPRLNYFRGKILIERGNNDAALDLLKKEVELFPDQENSKILLAQIYLTKGQLNDAEKWYKSVQIQAPRSIEALKGLAYVKFKRGEFEPAISIYKKVLKLRPDDASVYLILGDIYKTMGQFKEAKEAFKSYLEIDPDSELSLRVKDELSKMN